MSFRHSLVSEYGDYTRVYKGNATKERSGSRAVLRGKTLASDITGCFGGDIVETK